MWGERSERALCMNFVLRTAHAVEKKKRGHTNPDVRTIIIIYEKSQMYHPCGARFARPITVNLFVTIALSLYFCYDCVLYYICTLTLVLVQHNLNLVRIHVHSIQVSSDAKEEERS